MSTGGHGQVICMLVIVIVWILCWNLVSRDLLIVGTLSGNRESVSSVLDHCKLLPISQLEVNPALAFHMPLVVEEFDG